MIPLVAASWEYHLARSGPRLCEYVSVCKATRGRQRIEPAFAQEMRGEVEASEHVCERRIANVEAARVGPEIPHHQTLPVCRKASAGKTFAAPRRARGRGATPAAFRPPPPPHGYETSDRPA